VESVLPPKRSGAGAIRRLRWRTFVRIIEAPPTLDGEYFG